MSNALQTKLAERFGLDEKQIWDTLKATAFKVKEAEVSDAQMYSLMAVADQYGLNPFTKELFAFPDKQNGIVPVVSVDGWARIINDHGALDGIEFNYAPGEMATPTGGKPCPQWCESIITRKDRSRPIVIREYLDEVYRPPYTGKAKDGRAYTISGAWQSHTKRMLRHKALIQGARIAFGFAGIYDEDEAQRVLEARDVTHAADVEAKVEVKEKKLPEYPAESFSTNYPKWQKRVAAGKSTPLEIIGLIETKATLSDEQRDKIQALKAMLGKAERDLILNNLGSISEDAVLTHFGATSLDAIPLEKLDDILIFIKTAKENHAQKNDAQANAADAGVASTQSEDERSE